MVKAAAPARLLRQGRQGQGCRGEQSGSGEEGGGQAGSRRSRQEARRLAAKKATAKKAAPARASRPAARDESRRRSGSSNQHGLTESARSSRRHRSHRRSDRREHSRRLARRRCVQRRRVPQSDRADLGERDPDDDRAARRLAAVRRRSRRARRATGLGDLAWRRLLTFFGLLVFAAIVALALVAAADRRHEADAGAAAALRIDRDGRSERNGRAGGAAAGLRRVGDGARSRRTSIKAAADGAMLPLIVFTFLFALASRHIDASLRQALVDFFGAIAGAMTKLVDWIIASAPIGVFALVLVAASRVGVALAGAMAYYIVAIVGRAGAVRAADVSCGDDRRTHSARAVHARRAAGAGGGAELELVAGVASGARRGVAPAWTSDAGHPGSCCRSSVSTFKVATPITWLIGIAVPRAALRRGAGPMPSMVTIALTASR